MKLASTKSLTKITIYTVFAWVMSWAVTGLLVVYHYEHVWYPPVGVSLAMLVLFGTRAMPGIILGAGTVALLNYHFYRLDQNPIELLIVFTLYTSLHILVVWTGRCLLRRAIQRINKAGQSHNRPLFLVIAYITITFFIAVVNTMPTLWAYEYGHLLEAQSIDSVFWIWTLGGYAALLVFTPIILGVFSFQDKRLEESLAGMSFFNHITDNGPIAYKSLFNAVLVLSVLLYGVQAGGTLPIFALVMLVFPAIWMALTEPPGVAAGTMGVVALLVATFTDSFMLEEVYLGSQSVIILMAIMTWLIIALRTGSHQKDLVTSKSISEGFYTQTSDRKDP